MGRPVPSRRPIRAELGALLRLAVPLAAATGGQALMGVVDTAVTGRAGATTLAGTGLGNAMFFAVAIFSTGFMLGLEPMISQAVGAGDRGRARQLLWQAGWLALGLGGLAALPLALLPLGLVPLGIAPEVAGEAARYLWWRLPSLPAFLFYMGARSYFQGIGRTRPVVVAMIVANLVNVPADVLLVFGGGALPAWAGPLRAVPALGAGGAALATTLVTWLQAALLLLAVPEREGAERAPPRRPVRADLAQALRIGWPVGLHMGAEVGVFALVGFLAGRLGPAAIGAHQIAIALASLTFCVALGIGNAGGVRVGWAVGAGDTPAARRAGLVAFAAGAGFMALPALLFVAAPAPLARLMTGDPAVLAAAVPLLAVAAVFQISDGVQGVGAGVLRGAGDTGFTFAANMVGHWLLGLPLALLLGFGAGLGVTGLWWGLCAGLTVVALSLLGRFLRISAREIRPLDAARAAGAGTG